MQWAEYLHPEWMPLYITFSTCQWLHGFENTESSTEGSILYKQTSGQTKHNWRQCDV